MQKRPERSVGTRLWRTSTAGQTEELVPMVMLAMTSPLATSASPQPIGPFLGHLCQPRSIIPLMLLPMSLINPKPGPHASPHCFLSFGGALGYWRKACDLCD